MKIIHFYKCISFYKYIFSCVVTYFFCVVPPLRHVIEMLRQTYCLCVYGSRYKCFIHVYIGPDTSFPRLQPCKETRKKKKKKQQGKKNSITSFNRRHLLLFGINFFDYGILRNILAIIPILLIVWGTYRVINFFKQQSKSLGTY